MTRKLRSPPHDPAEYAFQMAVAGLDANAWMKFHAREAQAEADFAKHLDGVIYAEIDLRHFGEDLTDVPECRLCGGTRKLKIRTVPHDMHIPCVCASNN